MMSHHRRHREQFVEREACVSAAFGSVENADRAIPVRLAAWDRRPMETLKSLGKLRQGELPADLIRQRIGQIHETSARLVENLQQAFPRQRPQLPVDGHDLIHRRGSRTDFDLGVDELEATALRLPHCAVDEGFDPVSQTFNDPRLVEPANLQNATAVFDLSLGDVKSPTDISTRADIDPAVQQDRTPPKLRIVDGEDASSILVAARKMKEQVRDPVNPHRFQRRGRLRSDPCEPLDGVVRRAGSFAPPPVHRTRVSGERYAWVGSISKRH